MFIFKYLDNVLIEYYSNNIFLKVVYKIGFYILKANNRILYFLIYFKNKLGVCLRVNVLVKNLHHCADAEFSNFPLRLPNNIRIGKTQKKIFAISAGEAEALAKIFSSTLADTLVCNVVLELI